MLHLCDLWLLYLFILFLIFCNLYTHVSLLCKWFELINVFVFVVVVVVVVVTFEFWLVYSVLYSFKFKTKVAEAVYRAYIQSYLLRSHAITWKTKKLNPINSMRTGEEMEMLECKQFQTNQPVTFKGPQL